MRIWPVVDKSRSELQHVRNQIKSTGYRYYRSTSCRTESVQVRKCASRTPTAYRTVLLYEVLRTSLQHAIKG
jgi:hypothetical protein